ncbi:MAG: hypothetical protein HYW88_02060 [Candidatus Sungbacteria bacterium]|nr:hypothetical protein [Candidatus Sungbacteria bacterium]
MKILNVLGQTYPEEARKILSQLGDVEYRIPNPKELERDIGIYDIAVMTVGLRFDKPTLKKAVRLKIIVVAATGLDHIDLMEARRRNIVVLSLRGETKFLNTITGTAELAVGLMIDLLRLTPHAFDSVKRYEWDKDFFRGHNLYGKTLGIVGMGRLGKWMGRYGDAFGMKIQFFDPYVKKGISKKYKKVSLEMLLKTSDCISIHVHLGKDTENMFTTREFGLMKKNAYLINTSRGKIVNEKDVLAALAKKTIAGYATDVLAGELSFGNRFKNYPLVEYAKKNQNLIIVPHIGGMTHESREATDIFMARKLEKFLKTKK